MSINTDGKDYVALAGKVVLIGAASVEQTGMLPGVEYEFVAIDGPCVCRWDTTDAAPADGSFTFAVVEGSPVRSTCPAGNTLLNVEEATSASVATAVLLISQIERP